jgi:NhaP-type Na+/H+ or K+/H+ antiporter
MPVSLLLGVAAGILPALGLVQLLKKTSRPFFSPTLLAAGLALALVGLELALGRKVPQASLLSLMALGFILMHQREGAARTMAVHMKKAWGPVEILLFVLLGAQVDPAVALKAGLAGLGVIAAGLAARSLGVGLALWGTGFTFKEKKLAMISFVPKATVQAALGPLPLALGLAGGEVMLAVAVLSILVTAPLGALGIGWWGDRVLSRSPGHVRPFRRHRDSQGLPRVGWRIRERSTGLVWKVIEEREEWRVPEGESTLTPAIVLRIWREQDQPGPNRGPTRYLEFTPSGPGFDWHWEVVEAV